MKVNDKWKDNYDCVGSFSERLARVEKNGTYTESSFSEWCVVHR